MERARIRLASDPQALSEAANIIRTGGILAFPTETVYGLGADACNPRAVARIFEAKQRPAFDPLILHIAEPEDAASYAHLDHDSIRPLLDRFWPGPLTVVLRKKEIVSDIVTAGLQTVAIRLPSHPTARELIRRAGTALAAPSANLFGTVSPTTAEHVVDQLADRIDLVLDAGRCSVGIESTIVSLAEEIPVLLRTGGTPVEEIEAMLGPVMRETGPVAVPRAPGQLSRHYATRTPLTILHDHACTARNPFGERIGLLSLRTPASGAGFAHVEVLSRSGDLREAAANLFAALRRLDELKLDRILALPVPENGLGQAIMDRLRRGAVPEGTCKESGELP